MSPSYAMNGSQCVFASAGSSMERVVTAHSKENPLKPSSGRWDVPLVLGQAPAASLEAQDWFVPGTP